MAIPSMSPTTTILCTVARNAATATPIKRDQVYQGRPDAPTRSQSASADRSIKERGGRVPPRKAQEGVLGRSDLSR
jgi:hypothetical protein